MKILRNTLLLVLCFVAYTTTHAQSLINQVRATENLEEAVHVLNQHKVNTLNKSISDFSAVFTALNLNSEHYFDSSLANISSDSLGEIMLAEYITHGGDGEMIVMLLAITPTEIAGLYNYYGDISNYASTPYTQVPWVDTNQLTDKLNNLFTEEISRQLYDYYTENFLRFEVNVASKMFEDVMLEAEDLKRMTDELSWEVKELSWEVKFKESEVIPFLENLATWKKNQENQLYEMPDTEESNIEFLKFELILEFCSIQISDLADVTDKMSYIKGERLVQLYIDFINDGIDADNVGEFADIFNTYTSERQNEYGGPSQNLIVDEEGNVTLLVVNVSVE
jgi:hypothetical protein